MVYLPARTASHLYKSPSSLDLSSNGGGPKSLVTGGCGGGGSIKYQSLLFCSPTVRMNGNSNTSSNNSGSRYHGSTLTLNTRGYGFNNGGRQYEYSQSKSTLDLTWLGKDLSSQMSVSRKAVPIQKSSSTLNLKSSKSLFNLRQALSSVPNAHTQPSSVVNGRQMMTLPRNDRRPLTTITQPSPSMVAKAKTRASILWLIAKSTDNGRIPAELRDPFYRDHKSQESLKPWITQRLANGELYGRALANIYGVPDYSCLGHQGILQLLSRRGIYVQEMGNCDEPITETLLLKTSPVKLSAHMIIIECILTLYVREILIPVKVGEVVSRFTGDFDSFDPASSEHDLPPSSEPEDVALFWVNRACAQLNQEVARDYMNQEDVSQIDPDEPCPVVPSLDELSDMCDGCSLFGLLAFYCPTQLDWREICLKQDISIADSIYNLQRVQYFTAEHFPSDVCFLTLEDFLYLPEPLVPNFLAFIADLLFLFEIQPVECVTAPYLRLFPEGYGDEYQPNYPALPTPSEMKARSLKHQSWNDSLEMSQGESAFYNHPSTHQLYNDRRSSMYNKTGSNTALNQTSRRNSLSTNNNGSRLLHRRSSIISNGSESQPQVERAMNHGAPEIEEAAYANGSARHHHFHATDGDSENGMAADSSGGQLSSYFSTLSISNNRQQASGGGHHSALNMPEQEYYKNRNRASSGHLTDYFSNLTAAGTPSQPESSHYTGNRLHNTHVRAKPGHVNNADNVKSLLAHEMHQQQHSAFSNTPNVDSSQTTSSETSSIAELSEYSDLVRAQLNEKRKQIELERQQEREKRASVDQNFRQEVLRTLKGIHHNDDSNSDIDASENGGKMMDNVNNNSGAPGDDENLTFEIHELNPIRREKTFTSLASSKSLNNSSTYMRKNLFSASEDLKASMTDLNYSNAKDGSDKQNEQYNSPSKNSSNHFTEGQSNNKVDLPNEEKNYKSQTAEPAISAQQSQPLQSMPVAYNEYNETAPSSQQLELSANSPATSANNTPRRSQWGQPMMPLAGAHYSQVQTGTPNWSQGPPADWYGGQATYPPPPHHHMAHPGAYPYPYAMAQPPGPAPHGNAPPPMTRPYPGHMDLSQYSNMPPYATSEQYMSIGYMSQQSGAPPHNYAQNNGAPGSTYSSPLLSSSQMPMSPPQAQQQQMGSATFRVQKNGPSSFADATNTHHQQPPPINVESYSNSPNQSNHSVNNSLANNIEEGNSGQNVPAAEATTPSSEKHNEAFFISFSDERPAVNRSKHTVNKTPKTKVADLLSPDKQPLTRTATQTLVARTPQENVTPKQEEGAHPSKPIKSQVDPEVVKQLYEVKRPVAPPGVAFVVGADDTEEVLEIEQETSQELDEDGRPRPVTEEDMTRKKELIMKQSLRRRIEQEEKRIQKEQELAAKRESERIRREQSERKKEEEKAKRAFILEQYKQRKQIEEDMEKNGGQLQVSRSSSTLVLNRQTPQGSTVNMRPSRLLSSAGGRPRPKSLHSTLIGLDGNPIASGPQSGRLSNSRDEIDLVGRLSSNASRPQSALSSQLNLSTATTPTHSGPYGEAFGEFALNSNGPTSSTFYEYNGPKLFVKPSQKSNKTLILNAINVVLAGAVNAETNRRVAEVINSCDSKYYLILFRNSGLQYRAIYSYYPERDEVTKLDGIGPRSVNNEMIEKFYKYNSGTKAFTAIQTKHLCVTIDAFTIHNHFWMTKKQQQQQQNTPRRFI